MRAGALHNPTIVPQFDHFSCVFVRRARSNNAVAVLRYEYKAPTCFLNALIYIITNHIAQPSFKIPSITTTSFLFLLLLLLTLHRLVTNMAITAPTQTALLVTAIGSPVTSVSNWPIPQPGPKQVQIRVTVGGLNPHDQKARDIGLFIRDDLPAILGNDVVGVVIGLGEGASRFKTGDRVFGQTSMKMESKALQEYAVLDEEFAAEVPEGVGEDKAATLPTNIVAGNPMPYL
tara:strand:- start:2535 stop:3230 length:696 start_codon:yes stop_codon:yes gene_type:complete